MTFSKSMKLGIVKRDRKLVTLDKDELNRRIIVLRHDVDKMPLNSLHFAKLQYKTGVRGTYYFRAVPQSWDEKIIKQIYNFGHEVGYHYENLAVCKGNIDDAIKDFEANLNKLRKLVPVTTICMHGSPLSKYDNRDIWKKYNYRDFGIIGEPYFDIDFNKVAYYTDTGRRWDGGKVSLRDNLSFEGSGLNPDVKSGQGSSKDGIVKGKGLSTEFPIYKSTNDIIQGIQSGNFPTTAMLTFHPQRWTDNGFAWTKELVMQNVKNAVKYFIVKTKK